MKLKSLILALMAAIVLASAADCEAKKKKAEPVDQLSNGGDIPCAAQDDEEYYAATGSAYGYIADLDLLREQAIENARAQIIAKVKRSISGKDNYYKSSTRGTKARNHERNSDELTTMEYEAKIGDLEEVCSYRSEPDATGQITYFVGVRALKQDIVAAKKKAEYETSVEGIRDRAKAAREEE